MVLPRGINYHVNTRNKESRISMPQNRIKIWGPFKGWMKNQVSSSVDCVLTLHSSPQYGRSRFPKVFSLLTSTRPSCCVQSTVTAPLLCVIWFLILSPRGEARAVECLVWVGVVYFFKHTCCSVFGREDRSKTRALALARKEGRFGMDVSFWRSSFPSLKEELSQVCCLPG